MPPASDVTQLLQQWQTGNEAAMEQLMPLVYEELRRLAHGHLQRERADHTLNTTALVHEAYLNLVGQADLAWQNRAHFFGIASRVMRRVLIWYARRRNTDKRGGGQRNVELDEAAGFSENRLEELLALDQALQKLEALDERLCRVVECRYFGGLNVKETAEALNISPATVKRDWQTARAWLRRTLQHDGSA